MVAFRELFGSISPKILVVGGEKYIGGIRTEKLYELAIAISVNTVDLQVITVAAPLQRNVTIHWNGKTPLCGKFLRRLEYALPKYGKPDLNRFLSNSSQAYLTQHGASPVNTCTGCKTFAVFTPRLVCL